MSCGTAPRSATCRKIDFYVGSLHVDATGFELVAKALDAPVKKRRASILAHEVYAHLADKFGNVEKTRGDGA